MGEERLQECTCVSGMGLNRGPLHGQREGWMIRKFMGKMMSSFLDILSLHSLELSNMSRVI